MQSELTTLKVAIRDLMKGRMTLAWVTTVRTHEYMLIWGMKDPVLCASFMHIPLHLVQIDEACNWIIDCVPAKQKIITLPNSIMGRVSLFKTLLYCGLKQATHYLSKKWI